MPVIKYITKSGHQFEVKGDDGTSVMECAVNNDIEGIVAQCGGACACATCHVYVDEAWMEELAPLDEMEDSMLECAFDRKANSRLACQIEVSAALHGLVVQVADNEF